MLNIIWSFERRDWCKMTIEKIVIGLMCFLLVQGMTFGVDIEGPAMEKDEFQQDFSRIREVDRSLSEGSENSLVDYERFADELLSKWKSRNRENYARLVLAVCGPLGSGRFKEYRGYEVARKYALSALDKPQEISVETEMELTGYVTTWTHGPNAPKGRSWEELRRQDVKVRLHAWRRLLDSIDHVWDPNDLPVSNVVPPPATGLPSGIAPEAIQDPKLRAEYEAAIEANRQKAERYAQQNALRKWLERYPKRTEEFIVQAYSIAPCNNDELAQYLEEYKLDEKTKSRIVEAVRKSIAEQTEPPSAKPG